MNHTPKKFVAVAALMLASAAHAVPVSLTKLTGLTGGTLAGTAVYKADLSAIGLASILSIGIRDNSSGLGGAVGQFSGFDLDAIKLSTTDCADAACAKGAAGLSLFDFVSHVLFTPGTQRVPVDAKLFGTDASGSAVDNAVATLDQFDGESTTGPTVFGFLSLGDDGAIDFDLTAAASTTGLFLYIGEVGDNGEVAASDVIVREGHVLPEPGGLALFGLAAAGLAWVRRRR
ncbi:MAG: PEP-CTERM sorting domain-containing protein [Burkholderiales bacterium]|nr:PEP-CTERM sorting domain-containing protein [Burkholderiales bacterium]MBW8893655.1 PEP-CTERM sorting domain-containing protein [Burkholderiales bacterium]